MVITTCVGSGATMTAQVAATFSGDSTAYPGSFGASEFGFGLDTSLAMMSLRCP